MPTFGSLFSGVGALDLGLERAGWECRWQCELDDYARRVLDRHWPDVTRHADIHDLTGGELEPVDLIAGGPPCQPVSFAGRGAGQSDERWLWPQFFRIVGLVRPRLLLMENPPALLHRGMGDVLGTLSTLGYDAEWGVISACAFGAPHTRERLFIVAHANGDDGQARLGHHATRPQSLPLGNPPEGLNVWRLESFTGVRGVADGIASRVDRLRGIGNAVAVPVAQWLGQRLLTALAVTL